MKGISKGRKWKFDTSTDDTIVSCYYLANDESPYEKVYLLLEGESIHNKESTIINSNFNAKDFMKEGLKVDVKFDGKFWYCGEIQKVRAVQVEVSFFNNDKSIRMKPVAGEIRLCSHIPQRTSFSL